MRCRTRPSSASPARPCSSKTNLPSASSATTSRVTTSSDPRRTAATVKLVYENRGEKLGVARTDLNNLIATKIEEADLDPDEEALLEKLLGQDYEVITADERLEKIAVDFVEHCATRWQSGKSMLVCIDKITCARMLDLIVPEMGGEIGGCPLARN